MCLKVKLQLTMYLRHHWWQPVILMKSIASQMTRITNSEHPQLLSSVLVPNMIHMHIQSILKIVIAQLYKGQEVPVNIYPEPLNQFDAKAIAFKCWVNNDWHRIGYIVREALDNVHDAQRNGKILEVKFKWAEYLVKWLWSGPGYYAGINITRVGQCSSPCILQVHDNN